MIYYAYLCTVVFFQVECDMRKKDLTQGSIVGNIVSFSLPYMLASLLQSLYGLADLFVIGRYCGVDATTAVSNGAQVMYFVTVVLIGLAMGPTVRIAYAIGSKNDKMRAEVMGNSITVFLILAVILSVVLFSLTRPIVLLMQTPSEAIEGTTHYLSVCFAGIPFIMAYNVIAAMFRGLGDTRTPMVFVAVACVTNIALDFLLIGAFGMGPLGAAVATILSQALSVFFAIATIRRRNSEEFEMHAEDFRLRCSVLGNLMKIGLPVALQDGFIQVSFILITVIANMRGLDDAAAVGIVEKIIGLLFIVPSAMLATVSAMSAQNIGAGNMSRARRTLHYAICITFGYGLACACVVQVCPEAFMRIFTDNDVVVIEGAGYLRSYAWDCALAGVHFCFSGFFTSCGYALVPFFHNVVSIVTARVPLSYLFSIQYPETLYPMGWAAPIGSVVSIVICVIAYIIMSRRMRVANAMKD